MVMSLLGAVATPTIVMETLLLVAAAGRQVDGARYVFQNAVFLLRPLFFLFLFYFKG